MPGTALVLGGSGRFGRHAAAALTASGWQVHTFRRGGDLMAAAQGVDIIVNAWNPPYGQWAGTVPGLTRQVIAAAQASGATVVIPGNVYVYGAEMPEVIGPGVAHAATNTLGRIRVEMEAAYRASGVRTVILRAGDYIDTEASGNWFDSVIARKTPRTGRLVYPGRSDILHAWAYLPDLADALARLMERRDELPDFVDLAFAGYAITGEELAAACAAALDRPVTVKPMSWLPVQLARPFWSEAKGLLEMRYLWNTPHRLDGSALSALMPELAGTPLTRALKTALGVTAG